MPFFRSSEVIGIAAEALEFALQASEDAHPQEYMGSWGSTATGSYSQRCW